MPGLPLRRRRSEDEEGAEDDIDPPSPGSSPVSSPRSLARKRVRINENGDRSPSREEEDEGLDEAEEGEEDIMQSGRSRQTHAHQNGETGRTDNGAEQFQPGSIVRVKLDNFVTYTSAEFFPGPSLNMVIGPNGTGKSTLVCAICLGLGWGPQDVSEYVKRGCHEAMIEIELAGRPGDRTAKPVIRRQIKREGNKSHFWIDGRSSTLKGVLELAKSFAIQIDNLCQFLPQDKVCEFAALTPVELLHSTQRAAAPAHMIEWHENLKLLRSEQRKLQAEQGVDKETLANLDGRQQMLRADVENLRERAAVQEQLRLLETCRPFAKYRQARLRVHEAKARKNRAQAELKQLEDEVEPSLRAVNAKQAYSKQIEKVLAGRKKAAEEGENKADTMVKKQEAIQEKIKDLEQEVDVEKESGKACKQEIIRIESKMKSLERQMADAPADFEPGAYNEQIREKVRRVKELQYQVSQVRDSQQEWKRQGQEKVQRISRAQTELEDLDSQVGQQSAKLRQRSHETARAWEWIRQNQAMFEQPVYGPPIVECSVKDPRYLDAIESLFQASDFLTFTAQSTNDFKKLSDHLYGTMKLAEINIRNTTGTLDQFRPPVSAEQMQRFGFEGWALDYLAGPEPVLAMLCAECKINQTGVALGDISDRQYEELQRSPISSWVTGRASFQIARRAEYGHGATSTRVRDLSAAKVWTNQPVDMAAKTELRRCIEEMREELRELKAQIEAASEQIAEIQQRARGIDAEKKALEEEKAVKQKAQGEYRALPTKLAQLEDQVAAKRESKHDLSARLMAIHDRIDARMVEKCELGLEYAKHVADLQNQHLALLTAQIMHIESVSDLETLTSRNLSVKQHLETARRDVEQIVQESARTHREARELLNACQAILDDPATAEEQREFMSTLPKDQTPAELDAEIESLRARLELVHEGNPNAISEFERRQRAIDTLTAKIASADTKLGSMDAAIAEIRTQWEPELDALIGAISDAFARSFAKIGCAGQVGVSKDAADFDQWAVQIQVKFREDEPLALLTAHRQSGGERAVSTIFYLMALQSLARAPFRVVDEINQGMDPRNERVVHERMVDIACKEHTSQYFLITPKLLWGLRYHERMRVLCIASGEYMPGEEEKRRGLDAREVVRRRDRLMGGAGGGGGVAVGA